MARTRWVPPAYHPGELDRLLLRLCAPNPALPPRWVNPEALLARAAELDVFPLAFHRLRQSPRWPRHERGWLPGKTSSPWEERFRANAARNLLLDTEQERLLRILGAAGISALALKGTRLAAKLYGDLALRAQVDIDLYFPPRQLPVALRALEADGYRRLTAVGLPAERLAVTGDEFTSECSLEKRAAPMPILLELHWRILPLGAEDFGATLRAGALPAELEFLHLCLHASADRWGTLKTLVDLAHWVNRQPPHWEALAAAAARLGLARVLYVTLRVLLHYFDSNIPESLVTQLPEAASSEVPRAAVANPFAPLEPLSPAATHRLRWALRERLRDRLRYAAFLLQPTARDLAAARLPRGLGVLYWGLRWLRLAGWLTAGGKRQPVFEGVQG